MTKIKSIETSDHFIDADVEVVLRDGTHLGIEVCLVLELDQCIIYPLKFGGCLGVNPIKETHVHHLFQKDCRGNDLDLLRALHSKELISIERDPVDPNIFEWNFEPALAHHFDIKQDFKPTEELIRDMIQQLVEIALPKDLESRATEDTDNPSVNEAD